MIPGNILGMITVVLFFHEGIVWLKIFFLSPLPHYSAEVMRARNKVGFI